MTTETEFEENLATGLYCSEGTPDCECGIYRIKTTVPPVCEAHNGSHDVPTTTLVYIHKSWPDHKGYTVRTVTGGHSFFIRDSQLVTI